MLVGARIHRKLTMLAAGVMTIATMTLGVAGVASAALTNVTLSPGSGAGVAVGQPITATVTGTLNDAFTYQWYWCSTQVSSGTSTPSCTAETVVGSSGTLSIGSSGTTLSYTLQPSDYQRYVTIYVDDTTASAAFYPAPTTSVTDPAPSASSPTLATSTASPTLGTALTASNTFSLSGLSSSSSLSAFTQHGITAYNATVVSYQWYDCPSAVTVSAATTAAPSCTSISNEKGTSYTPTSSDALNNYKLLVAETVTNAAGSLTVFSPTTNSVTGSASTLSVSESLTNNASFSASATLSGGASSITPSYAYEWYACSGALSPTPTTTPVTLGTGPSAFSAPTTSSGSCTALAAGASYTVTSTALIGDGLVAEAIATVPGVGWWMNYSAQTALASVSASVTGVTVATTSTGAQATTSPVGSTLYASAAITAMPAATPSYVWYLCGTTFVGGASAPSCGSSLASLASFTPSLTTSQLNNGTYYVVAGVTAGTSSYYSASVTLTTASPLLVTYPTVPATASTVSALLATQSTWTGAPTPTLTNQWYVCTGAVGAPGTSLAANCSVIAGATGLSFQPTATYVHDYFLIATTADNGVLSNGVSTAKTVYSASTTQPLVATIAITSLTISGTATVGSTLTAIPVVANLGNAYTAAYQWYECATTAVAGTAVPATCSAISGATGASFVVTSNQASYYLSVFVTVTGSSTTASALAASTGLVTTSVPGSPTSVTAVAGIGQATVSWLAPTTGLAVTSYRVTASNGAFCTTTTTSCVVAGLLYGTAYTFTVTATNAYGTSPASLVSNAVTPSESYPAAPTAVTAVAGIQSATLSWTAAVNNGSLVTAYVVTSYPGGVTCTTTATTCVVSGLTGGTSYTFTVTARNAVGTGPSSLASSPVVAKVNAPSAPVNVVVKRGNGSLTVTWAAGLANGAVTTGYLVSATGGGTSHSCTTTSTTCVVSGLTNGVAYSVTVVAQSAGATTSTVVPSPITPAGRPSAPAIVRAFGGVGVVIAYFHAPSALNGAPIAYYQYLINGRWTVQTLKGRLFVVVRGLLRHHAYILRVRAVSVGGPSPASMWVRVITR